MARPLSMRQIYPLGTQAQIETDDHGWILRRFVDSTGKDGEPIKAERVTYYLTFAGAAAAGIEFGVSGADTLGQIIPAIAAAENRIIQATKDIPRV